MCLSAAVGDVECTEAPAWIRPWVLPTKETKWLFAEGQGTAPDFIYAIDVQATPNPD
jgi:hypothetical protein